MPIQDGDYFACFEPRIDRWVAWQTVGMAPHGREIAIAPLDWFGEQRPVPAELSEAPLLGVSHSRPALPLGAVFVGNGPARVGPESRFRQRWNTDPQVQLACRRAGTPVVVGRADTASDLIDTASGVLDARDSGLMVLTVDPAGLKEILLPSTIWTLNLTTSGDAPAGLRISTPLQGAELELKTTGSPPRITGIERLRELHVSEIRELDVHQLVSDFPHVRALRLWGRPGRLGNVDALTQLDQLHTLWLQDLFGWTADEWPGSDADALPKLTSLLLNSVPADVARAAKSLMSARRYGWAEITAPRSPQWLAENIDNPLRAWNGRAGIRAADAKRAVTLYRDCLRRAHALASALADSRDTPLALAEEFLQGILAINENREFMDAGEREEALSALELLMDAAGATAEEAAASIALGEDLLDM